MLKDIPASIVIAKIVNYPVLISRGLIKLISKNEQLLKISGSMSMQSAKSVLGNSIG